MFYTCADCSILACAGGTAKEMPLNCPMRQMDMRKAFLPEYEKVENHRFYVQSSSIEAEGYCQWPRLKGDGGILPEDGISENRIGISARDFGRRQLLWQIFPQSTDLTWYL